MNSQGASHEYPGHRIRAEDLGAYAALCKPLCQKLHLPQTAFDILMFLANNPGYQTASDVVEVRKLKANLVSVNIDRLVQEATSSARLTPATAAAPCCAAPKSLPIIEQGRALQEEFGASLLEHTNEAQRKAFFETMDIIMRIWTPFWKEKYERFILGVVVMGFNWLS